MKFGLWTWPSFLLFQCVIGGSNEQRQLFRKQPENRTSIEGEVAILECEVENPSGLVQWVKDGLLLGPGRVLPGFPRYRVTGSKAAGVFNLQIEKAGLEDDASYQCQVSRSDSSLGIISNTAWLDVLIPPGVPTIQELATQGSVTWVAGEEYLLTCNVQDSKPPSTIIFKKSGVELSGSESTVTPGTKDKLFNTVSVIRVTPQSSDNRNEMLCGAVNAALTQPRFTGFTMSILFPPQMPRIEGYDHHQVKAGVTLQLVCSSSGGSPLATLQWLKGETVISRIWETDDERKTAQSVLSYPVTAQDNGLKLTCEAMNQVTSRPLRRAIVLHVVYAPSRVTIFGSTRAGENKQISLSCSTSASNPGARVRWWASGKELNITEVTYTEAADGGTITISNVTLTVTRQDNGMSIVCEAVNEAVFVTKSASVVIKVHYPPERIWIQGPPEMTPFRAGTKVTLCCFASGGIPPARLTWRKDSNPVSGGIYRSTGKLAFSELTIITVPSDNQAKYQCSAINEATTAALTTVTRITVQFAPIDVKITTSAAVVHRGQSMTLSCQTGSSNPVAQIAWIKDGVRLTGEELETQEADYGGQSSSAQITIVVSSSDNGKRVTCQAHSPILNEALNTFYTLAVLYPPEFSEGQLRVVQAMERGAAVIPIKVTANPPEVTYTWSRNGQVLVKDGPSRHHLKEGGTLEIWNLIRDDSGFYKIHLRNEEGENEALLKLDVQYSARIYSIGDPTEVDLGESVEMVCEADANPVRNKMVTWKWTGQGREIIEEDQIFMHNATKLIIEVAKRSDAGIYECGADNGIPPGATSRAQLIVRYKPELRKGVHLSKVAVLGDGMNSATLSCKAEGIPDVEFNWAKTGVSLDLSNPRYSQVTFHEGPLHTSQLTITNASAAQDYAIFTCTAQNPLGLDFFDIQLVSTSRPDSPTGLTMLSKTHNSITLEWSEGFNGGLEQSFQVRYFWTGATRPVYVDVFPSQATTFTITGLNPWTVYNVSVSASNALGTSDYEDRDPVLTVITSDNPDRDPFPTESLLTPAPRPDGLLLPVLLLIPLLSLTALLLILNTGFIVRLAQRRRQRGRQRGKQTETSGRVKQLELNLYGDEFVNITSKQTLLIDSELEQSHRTYESYSDSSSLSDQAPDVKRRLCPAGDFRPRLFPLQESDDRLSDETPSSRGIRQREAWEVRLESLQDAEAGEQGLYEDVSEDLGRPLGSPQRFTKLPTSDWPSLSPPRTRDTGAMTSRDPPVGGERRGGAEFTEFRGRDYDELFDLRGELV